MRYNSINFKLIALVVAAFVLTSVVIITLANFQLTLIIDQSQSEVFSGELDTISASLARRYDRLQQTLQVEAYEADFQSLAINELRDTYYAPGQTVYPFILDNDGSVVVHPEFERGNQALAGQEFVQRMLTLKSGEFEFADQNGATWVIFRHFPEWDWIVAYTMPLEVKYSDVRQFRNIFILIMGVVTLLVISVLWVLITRFTRPITALTAAASAMRAGNLDISIETGGRDEVGQLAANVASMRDAVREYRDNLADLVAERTQQLEIVANLSEYLSSILDVDQLLNVLVNQVKDNFDYYHAHIYSLDEAGEILRVAAGTGEAGATMMATGHHIPLNAATSLVARAARSKEIVRVDNVRQDPGWLPNQLLPDTYAEMAVPIILEGQVVGVLDVQEDEIGGLDEGDANLLRSLANQVAIALRNARLFTEVETALTEAQIAQARYVQQAWQSQVNRQQAVYGFQQPGDNLLDEAVITDLHHLAAQQSQPTIIQAIEDDSQGDGQGLQPYMALVTPIKLQDQIIGTLELHETDTSRRQTWNEAEVAIVQAIIDQFAQTAENLRLFDETRDRASREATIREITDKLRATPNLDTLLETAARELGQQLGVRHTILELGIETDHQSLGLGKNGGEKTEALYTPKKSEE